MIKTGQIVLMLLALNYISSVRSSLADNGIGVPGATPTCQSENSVCNILDKNIADTPGNLRQVCSCSGERICPRSVTDEHVAISVDGKWLITCSPVGSLPVCQPGQVSMQSVSHVVEDEANFKVFCACPNEYDVEGTKRTSSQGKVKVDIYCKGDHNATDDGVPSNTNKTPNTEADSEDIFYGFVEEAKRRPGDSSFYKRMDGLRNLSGFYKRGRPDLSAFYKRARDTPSSFYKRAAFYKRAPFYKRETAMSKRSVPDLPEFYYPAPSGCVHGDCYENSLSHGTLDVDKKDFGQSSFYKRGYENGVSSFYKRGLDDDLSSFYKRGLDDDLSSFYKRGLDDDLSSFYKRGLDDDFSSFYKRRLDDDLSSFYKRGLDSELSSFYKRGLGNDVSSFYKRRMGNDVSSFYKRGLTNDLSSFYKRGLGNGLSSFYKRGLENDMSSFYKRGLDNDLSSFYKRGGYGMSSFYKRAPEDSSDDSMVDVGSENLQMAGGESIGTPSLDKRRYHDSLNSFYKRAIDDGLTAFYKRNGHSRFYKRDVSHTGSTINKRNTEVVPNYQQSSEHVNGLEKRSALVDAKSPIANKRTVRSTSMFYKRGGDNVSSFYKRANDRLSNFYKRGSTNLSSFYKRRTNDLSSFYKRGIDYLSSFYKRGPNDLSSFYKRAPHDLSSFYKRAPNDLSSFYKRAPHDLSSFYKRGLNDLSFYKRGPNDLSSFYKRAPNDLNSFYKRSTLSNDSDIYHKRFNKDLAAFYKRSPKDLSGFYKRSSGDLSFYKRSENNPEEFLERFRENDQDRL